MDIQLFHSDLPAGQNKVDVFDERRVELLDRRNRGAVFLSNSGEGITAFYGVVDRSRFLLFHQSIDLCLHGRIIIPGSGEAFFAVGSVSEEVERLIRVTEASFYKGIEQALPDRRIGDIGAAIEGFVRENGFTVVRDFIGHGVGEKLHEDPEVPNYGIAGRGVRLRSGMTIAVEPMVNAGTWRVKTLSDGWTVKTLDGRLSAHYENTICVSDNGPVILTAV